MDSSVTHPYMWPVKHHHGSENGFLAMWEQDTQPEPGGHGPNLDSLLWFFAKVALEWRQRVKWFNMVFDSSHLRAAGQVAPVPRRSYQEGVESSQPASFRAGTQTRVWSTCLQTFCCKGTVFCLPPPKRATHTFKIRRMGNTGVAKVPHTAGNRLTFLQRGKQIVLQGYPRIQIQQQDQALSLCLCWQEHKLH